MKRLVSLLLVLCFAFCLTGCQPLEGTKTLKTSGLLAYVDANNAVAKVSKFYTYGTHFNVYGTIEFSKEYDKQSSFSLVLKNDKEEVELETEIEAISEKSFYFGTGETINTGLYLDDLKEGTYYLLLRESKDKTTTYYTVEASDPEAYGCVDIDYYTLTRNGKNNEITIGFDTSRDLPCLKFDVASVDSLPDDVYDVVIDAGHGGKDSGALSNDGSVSERVINLKHANALKIEFEKLGLKVYMTRTSDEETDEDTVHNIFDENGKITLANGTKAKFYFAIHMNSCATQNQYSGFEIYCAPKADVSLESSMANSLINAGIPASNMPHFNTAAGVYQRGFTDSEILELEQTAKELGFTMYENIRNDTPYYYFIRDVGGIVTGAYTDGRNPKYGTNIYMNTNQGIESYLFELAYINNDQDLAYILEHYEDYTKAIAEGFASYCLK